MGRKLQISYIYASKVVWQRFDSVCDQQGWTNKSFVQQIITTFLKEHKAFYVAAALKDADARGITESDYYRTLRDGTEDDLPLYIKGRPGYGITPLDQLPFREIEQNISRKYNFVNLSNYNSVLFKVAVIVDTGPVIHFASRILHQHFDTCWDPIYFPEMELDRTYTF